MKNGSRGAPILLKRPKDSTILKVQPGAYKLGNYKRRPDGTQVIKCERPLPRVVRSAAPKQREKLVCPVCGILTFTLGNHMTTHEGNNFIAELPGSDSVTYLNAVNFVLGK